MLLEELLIMELGYDGGDIEEALEDVEELVDAEPLRSSIVLEAPLAELEVETLTGLTTDDLWCLWWCRV